MVCVLKCVKVEYWADRTKVKSLLTPPWQQFYLCLIVNVVDEVCRIFGTAKLLCIVL